MFRNRKRRGSATIEFALAGIPLICVTISTIQMGIAMWHYHTLQYATKEATAYLTHKGQNFIDSGNAAIKVKDVAAVLKSAAIGMPPSTLQVTFKAYRTSGGVDIQTLNCRLDNCLTNTTSWPPTGYNTPNISDVSILTDYNLRSAQLMVAQGWKSKGSAAFANSYWLPGYARQQVLY
jgi:hypothetical protein